MLAGQVEFRYEGPEVRDSEVSGVEGRGEGGRSCANQKFFGRIHVESNLSDNLQIKSNQIGYFRKKSVSSQIELDIIR